MSEKNLLRLGRKKGVFIAFKMLNKNKRNMDVPIRGV